MDPFIFFFMGMELKPHVFDLTSFLTKNSCHLRSVFIPSQIRISRGFAALHAIYRKNNPNTHWIHSRFIQKCWPVKKRFSDVFDESYFLRVPSKSFSKWLARLLCNHSRSPVNTLVVHQDSHSTDIALLHYKHSSHLQKEPTHLLPCLHIFQIFD